MTTASRPAQSFSTKFSPHAASPTNSTSTPAATTPPTSPNISQPRSNSTPASSPDPGNAVLQIGPLSHSHSCLRCSLLRLLSKPLAPILIFSSHESPSTAETFPTTTSAPRLAAPLSQTPPHTPASSQNPKLPPRRPALTPAQSPGTPRLCPGAMECYGSPGWTPPRQTSHPQTASIWRRRPALPPFHLRFQALRSAACAPAHSRKGPPNSTHQCPWPSPSSTSLPLQSTAIPRPSQHPARAHRRASSPSPASCRGGG